MSRSPVLGAIVTVMILTTVAGGMGPYAQDTGEIDEDDIFADVFGDAAEQDSVLPVYRNGQFLGEVQARIVGNDAQVGGAAIVTILEDLVNEDTLSALAAIVDAGALIEIDRFAESGVFLTYRPARTELDLSLSPASLREQTIGEAHARAVPNLQSPTDLSGYVNLHLRGFAYTGEQTDRMVAGFDPVVNYLGWVAEASLGIASAPLTEDDHEDDPVTLEYVRLVRDFPEQQLRGEAGLVRYERGLLFGGPELMGVSVTRVDGIDRDAPLFRSEDLRFVVPEYAPVDILLNERRYRRENLNEGPYRLPDIPLGRGINRVRVEQHADDDSDPEILLAEEIPFAPQLLVPRRHTYSWALGMLRDEWEGDALIVSGTHRMGVFREWTAGADLQAAWDEYALGLHSLLATRFGLSRVDTAGFLDNEGNLGGALEISHLLALLYTSRVPSVEVTGAVESPDYRRVRAAGSAGGRLRGGVSLYQRFAGTINGSLSVGYTYPFDDEEDPETVVRAAVSHQSPRGYTINAAVTPSFSDGEVQWQAGLFVRFGSDDGRVNTTVNYDLAQNAATLQVANVPRSGFNALNWTARYERSAGVVENTRSVGGSARYTGYRGTVSVQPAVRIPDETDPDARVTAQASTAVAWAGSAVAVTRPIRDGFAVFVSRPELREYPVPLRLGGGAETARLHGRAAVVPDLPSYRVSTVRLDGAELPEGLSVGERDLSFVPGYRQGYRVSVGSSAVVYGVGRIVDAEGDPVPLEAGELVPVDRTGEPILFFTNREGAFEIADLEAGRYNMYLLSMPDALVEIVIPEEEWGRYEMGDVVFSQEES